MLLKILVFTILALTLNFGVCGQNNINQEKPLKVGATAPDFTLTSNKNGEVKLSNVGKPTMLIFYRGYW